MLLKCQTFPRAKEKKGLGGQGHLSSLSGICHLGHLKQGSCEDFIMTFLTFIEHCVAKMKPLHPKIPMSCEQATLYGKSDFVRVIKDLEIGMLCR